MSSSSRTAPQRVSPTPSVSSSSSASTTPSTASPTSPRHSLILPHGHNPATKQLRPPKSPLYVPAVLRPTQRPSRPCHTPSASSNSTTTLTGRNSTPSPPQSSHSSSSSIHTISSANFNASATATTATATATGTLVPQPTRAHWKADSDASLCDAAGCTTPFSLLSRRHHCRRCGGIFCATHSSELVPLDQDAEFNPNGAWWRSCGICGVMWRERQRWEEAAAGGGKEVETGVSSPVEVRLKGDGKGSDVLGVGQASVPRDWNWSTF